MILAVPGVTTLRAVLLPEPPLVPAQGAAAA